ncbi:TPA: hypothetical protein ACNVSH_002299 [Klebsiella aerogenes]|uniref:hypothetical protein n=1 Tax=Klebsiella aerogenes TaxID=548 RepID=UPI00049EAF96|nr:hypothetical protein [Klebsiella aerogenes]KDF30717.1 hypothetical protein AE04_02838 [Klebsiella aerogenes MGH 78]
MSTEFIWRYLDIEKFSMLLKQQALFFCSAKKFEDPFEGEFAWGRIGYEKFIETQKKTMRYPWRWHGLRHVHGIQFKDT